MPKPKKHEAAPAFSRYRDWEGNLFRQTEDGTFVRDRKSLDDYRGDYIVEPVVEVQGMWMFQFFRLVK